MAGKEVAEESAKEVAVVDAAMFEADAGVGMQMDQDDLALPFLKILSGNDDILETIDAKPVDIYNTVTGAVYKGKDGVKVIPCHYERRFLMWSPRGSGNSAPLQNYGIEDARPETKRDENDNKDYVVGGEGEYLEETHQHYVMVMESDGTFSTALIPMKSTQLKKSRKWNSMIASRTMLNAAGQAFQPPRFSHVYKMATTKEENSKGSWHGWSIELDGQVEDANVYRAAKAFYESIKGGDVTVKHTADDQAEGGDAPF